MLGMGVDSNLAPTIDWLKSNLSLTDTELKKIVLGKPEVLGYSIDANLAPTIDWLTSRLSLSDSELKKLVLRLPSVLGCSVDDNLAPTIDFFERELGVIGSDLTQLQDSNHAGTLVIQSVQAISTAPRGLPGRRGRLETGAHVRRRH